MTDIITGVVLHDDLAKLTDEERAQYYQAVCESLGLNPLTKPFAYIRLNKKLTLYARRDAADQLRRIHDVSIEITARERHDDVYVVTARATTPEGRQDESTGAVAIGRLSGDALANAYMKAETKAKRRVTLSLIGLGWLDESEIGNIPEAEPVKVDAKTGEIKEQAGATNANAVNGSRPWRAERLLANFRGLADTMGRKPASKAQRETLVRCLEALFMNDSKEARTAKRHALTLQAFGIESSKDPSLLSAHCRVLLGWAIKGGDDEDTKWEPNALAVKEAPAIVKLYEAERGQADMFGTDLAEQEVIWPPDEKAIHYEEGDARP